MHDTVWFEIQGIPAVTIASSEFQTAAATQAEALGLKKAPCVFVPHPIQDATDSEMESKAEACLDAVIDALVEKEQASVS